MIISTHALTWSATYYALIYGIPTGISTHALTWSATAEIGQNDLALMNFNSRTHVECDNNGGTVMVTLGDFNSRTHVECDAQLPSW